MGRRGIAGGVPRPKRRWFSAVGVERVDGGKRDGEDRRRAAAIEGTTGRVLTTDV